MATTIFKLVMDGTTTTTTTTNPAIEGYFYKLAAVDVTLDTANIASTSFFDSTGASVVSNLTLATTADGYYLLFIDGVLQETSLYTIASTGSSISVTQVSTVPVSAPFTLLVNNFAPNSISTTTITS